MRQRIRKSKAGKAAWLAHAPLIALIALGLAGSRTLGTSPAQVSQPERHVLVISVDGMGGSVCTGDSPNVRIPHLRRLKEEGSFAEGVVSVYPSLTYPAHTTLVTGRLPAAHGVYTNLSSREAGKNPRDWFWFSSAIKVPTLWEEARRAHLTSASVSWPVTVGASIDWNVPEIWDPAKGDVFDLHLAAKYATPGLIEQVLVTLDAPQTHTDQETLWAHLAAALLKVHKPNMTTPAAPQTHMDQDTLRARFAAALLKMHKPNLLLVHLEGLDKASHQHGPQSAEAAEVLEHIDALIGELLQAVREAGLGNSTDVFIVSDHGFLTIDHEISPNVLFVKAGLLRADARGVVTGGKIATVSNGGSFFIYLPETGNLRRKVYAALKPLREQGMLWAVLNQHALTEMGAEPAIQLALEAPSGSGFTNRARGEVVSLRKTPGGTHGHLPFRNGLEASFIAWGPGVKRGVNLHRIRMRAIGPTILKALGIHDAHFGEHPPLLDIFK